MVWSGEGQALMGDRHYSCCRLAVAFGFVHGPVGSCDEYVGVKRLGCPRDANACSKSNGSVSEVDVRGQRVGEPFSEFERGSRARNVRTHDEELVTTHAPTHVALSHRGEQMCRGHL